MQLTVLESSKDALRAGYECPCGCTPSVEVHRASTDVREGCCCGNEFAVGQHVGGTFSQKAGFREEVQTFDAPWGERLEAAWLIGASVHGPADGTHDSSGEHHGHQGSDSQHADNGAVATDPVCGMTVEPESARAKGLASTFDGRDFYFCGKGCKLDFDDDPQRYLDPRYVPSM